MDKEGNLGRFVRAIYQRSSNVNDGWMFSHSNSHGPWHPVEKILDLFLGIDGLAVQLYFIACVKYLESIESMIKDDSSTDSLKKATMSLVFLNTNLSKLRTTLQYLHTSVAVLKLNTPELETPRHQEVLLEDLKPRPEKEAWEGNLISSARPDRTDLRPHVKKQFENANWYNSGLSYRLEQLDMVLVQRLLDVESAEQRIQISLSVVRPLLFT
jgi:hypothetical protein